MHYGHSHAPADFDAARLRGVVKYLPAALALAVFAAGAATHHLVLALFAVAAVEAFRLRLVLIGRRAPPHTRRAAFGAADGGTFPGGRAPRAELSAVRPTVLDGGSLEHRRQRMMPVAHSRRSNTAS
jgi:hypothetical protein